MPRVLESRAKIRAKGSNLLRTAILLTLAGASAMAPPAQAKSWLFELPPDVVKIDSGRRSHVFYVGQPVTFRLEGAAAARYEVRDYYGRLVDQGPAGPSLSLKAKPPGWYKLYLSRKEARAPWGPPWAGRPSWCSATVRGSPRSPRRTSPAGPIPPWTSPCAA
jgi:hypothetical protein